MTAEKLDGILRQQVPDAVKRRKATMVIPTGLGLAPTRLALAIAVRRLLTRRGRAWPPNPWRDRFTAHSRRRDANQDYERLRNARNGTHTRRNRPET